MLLEPEYDKAAEDLKHMVKFAAIDTERHPNLASAVQKKYGFQVTGVPTIKLVTPGKDIGSQSASDYNGERKAKVLGRVATRSMPSFVASVSEKNLDGWLEKGPTGVRKAVLLSAKSEVAPLFKAISSQYRGSIDFAQVSTAPAGDVAKRFKVSSLPALAILRREADDLEQQKWLEEKFPGGASFVTIVLDKKTTFRKLEGSLMGYSRAPRSKAAPERNQKGAKSGEL